jgi:hypothetical protein
MLIPEDSLNFSLGGMESVFPLVLPFLAVLLFVSLTHFSHFSLSSPPFLLGDCSARGVWKRDSHLVGMVDGTGAVVPYFESTKHVGDRLDEGEGDSTKRALTGAASTGSDETADDERKQRKLPSLVHGQG